MEILEINKEWLLGDKYAVQCETLEQANSLCEWLTSIGRRWCSGYSYTNNVKWERYKENTCYIPYTGEYSSLEFYKSKRVVILKYEDLFKKEELK